MTTRLNIFLSFWKIDVLFLLFCYRYKEVAVLCRYVTTMLGLLRNYIQSWTLIITQMRNAAKKCFSVNMRKVLIFGLLVRTGTINNFFVSGIGTRFLLTVLLDSSE